LSICISNGLNISAVLCYDKALVDLSFKQIYITYKALTNIRLELLLMFSSMWTLRKIW